MLKRGHAWGRKPAAALLLSLLTGCGGTGAPAPVQVAQQQQPAQAYAAITTIDVPRITSLSARMQLLRSDALIADFERSGGSPAVAVSGIDCPGTPNSQVPSDIRVTVRHITLSPSAMRGLLKNDGWTEVTNDEVGQDFHLTISKTFGSWTTRSTIDVTAGEGRLDLVASPVHGC